MEYGKSGRCFPLAYIVRAMEIVRCKGRCSQSAFRCLLAAGISYNHLLQVYEAYVIILCRSSIFFNSFFYPSLASSTDRTWAHEGNEFHIIQTIAELTDHFAENPSVVPAANRSENFFKFFSIIIFFEQESCRY